MSIVQAICQRHNKACERAPAKMRSEDAVCPPVQGNNANTNKITKGNKGRDYVKKLIRVAQELDPLPEPGQQAVLSRLLALLKEGIPRKKHTKKTPRRQPNHEAEE